MTLSMLFLIFIIPACFAEKIDYSKNLWMGIIGEAVGEGYEGMYAVACVYRNRIMAGMPLGCVAMKRNDLDQFVKEQGKKQEIMAKKIIWKVFKDNSPDITGGATHYENITAFGFPFWAAEMKITTTVGSHTFFVEK